MGKFKDFLQHKETDFLLRSGMVGSVFLGAAFAFIPMNEMSHQDTVSQTETQRMLTRAFTETAESLIQQKNELALSVDENAQQILEDLKQIEALGDDAHYLLLQEEKRENYRQDVDNFLEILATDSYVSESTKEKILNDLKRKEVLLETHPAYHSDPVFLEECQIDGASGNDIYACSAEKGQEFKDGALERTIPFGALFMIFASLGVARSVTRPRKKAPPKYKH